MSTKEDQDIVNAKLIQHRLDQMEGRAPIAEAQVGGEQELTAEQRAKLPYVAVKDYPCLMKDECFCCVETPHVIGSMPIPVQYRRGRSEDRVFYTLCVACASFPNARERAECEMLRRLGG